MNKIKKMSKSDVAEISELCRPYIKNNPALEITLRALENSNSFENAYVAEVDGKIVGFVYGMTMSGILCPQYLFVQPLFRRKGIGRKLMETIEKSSGYSNSIISHHESLQEYYLKQGYIYEYDCTIGRKTIV